MHARGPTLRTRDGGNIDYESASNGFLAIRRTWRISGIAGFDKPGNRNERDLSKSPRGSSLRGGNPEWRGRLDEQTAFVPLNGEPAHNALMKRGVGIEYREWPGAHDWSYWRAHVGQSLTWIASRIAGADKR